MSLEEKLDRIRTPNLQNQAQTSIILTALEDILREQNTEFTATAYFSALLSILNQYISPDEIINKDLAAGVVYLLDLVTPFTPEALLRAKFVQILTHLAPAITNPSAEAPILKSSIGCLETLLLFQDGAAWQIPQGQIGPKRAVAALLNLGLDPRPKVRKRALEAITQILQNPPPSPSLDHPATEMCAERSLQVLVELAKNTPKNAQHDPKTIHSLQLIRAVAAARGWPSRRIETLCEVLLNIARSNNELMTMASLDVFEVIFESLKDEMTSAKLPTILEAISELRPSQNDSQLLPPWLTVIARGYGVSAEIEPKQTFIKLPELFATISTFLESSSYNIRSSSSQCLIALTVTCIPDDILIKIDKGQTKILNKIADTSKGLVNVRYQGAWKEVFDVYEALFERLRWKAEFFLGDIVKALGDLRGNSSFLGKKEADKVLASAIGAMGPQRILEILPLNLLHPSQAQPGRAWLLPILRDSVHNTNIGHFKEEMIPLFQALFEKLKDHSGKEKTMELKIFETVIQQIWAIFPGYCDLPMDLVDAFDQPFAELLANVLYGQVDLRVSICQGLQILVESNKAILLVEEEDGEEDIILQNRLYKADAKRNIEKLASLSTNILLVLFNIYNETLPQFRGYILKCADSFLGITPPQEIAATFNKVTEALHQALVTAEGTEQEKKKPAKKGPADLPPMSHNLMDLIVTMAPHIGVENLAILFNVFTAVVNKKEDPQLQKKAYKVIPRIVDSDVGKTALLQQLGPLQTLLRASKESTSLPARRDRLAALAQVVELLPPSDLTFIFAIMDEVIQGAKEVNEKARAAAFDLLVIMGDKMSKGGIIKRSTLDFNDTNAPDVEASIEDFFLMVCAGLASPEAHMISATITAVTRILYQFKDELKPETITELVTTMDAFLTSNNREIVQSVLGFVKVSVISLPKELILPRLNSLIPNLMTWSHEHKAHFKAKVKHIIERMIRRFGYDVIERNVPDEDKKLVINIRKTKERKKRRKEEGLDEADEAAPKKQSKFASEFEEAIYGSESENSASEDEAEQQPLGAKSPRKSQTKQFIIEDEDEPLDLLDRNALAHISSTKPQQRRSQQADQDRQKTPAKTNKAGKLVITENDDDNENDDDMDVMINESTIANGEARDGISAYIQALKGKDAFTRGARDKIKFSNKRRKEEDEFDDDMMDGEDNDGDVGMGGVSGGGHGGRDRKNSTGNRGGRGGFGRGGRGNGGGNRDRQGSFGGRGGRGGGGNNGSGGGRVQKPPQSPKQRGGGTASIGRKKF